MSAGGLGSIAAAAAAQQSATSAAPDSKEPTADDEDDEMPELEAVEDAGPVDEADLDPKEIEMVMEQVCILLSIAATPSLLWFFQTGCSRPKAIAVLKNSGGDLINASMYSPAPSHQSYANSNAFSPGSEWVVCRVDSNSFRLLVSFLVAIPLKLQTAYCLLWAMLEPRKCLPRHRVLPNPKSFTKSVRARVAYSPLNDPLVILSQVGTQLETHRRTRAWKSEP